LRSPWKIAGAMVLGAVTAIIGLLIAYGRFDWLAVAMVAAFSVVGGSAELIRQWRSSNV